MLFINHHISHTNTSMNNNYNNHYHNVLITPPSLSPELSFQHNQDNQYNIYDSLEPLEPLEPLESFDSMDSTPSNITNVDNDKYFYYNYDDHSDYDEYNEIIRQQQPHSHSQSKPISEKNIENHYENDIDIDNNMDNDTDTISCYSDDGEYDYFAERLDHTLLGWTYTQHKNSICLTPPNSWKRVPEEINVNWYKRPLYYSEVHDGYFVSNSNIFVDKVKELGALPEE
jgi:hypothetical protein